MVKVQRPQVATLVQEDLRVMAWLAPLFVGRIPVAALANPPALVELFAETIVEELDFRLEAENMLDVSRSMRQLGQAGLRHPPPAPRAGHPPGAGHGAAVSGFALDEVDAMKAAGVDLMALIRTGIIGFLEGAMFHGVFHGDLHGGNLFIQPDGRTALLDFGITGRLDEPRRLAFLKLLAAGSTNDVRAQLPALAELGALPLDTDFEALIAELGLDDPAVDPTQMDPDEMVGRAPAGAQGPPRLRRPHAQGADAVRQEHGVQHVHGPDPRPRPGHPGPDPAGDRALRHSPTASASPHDLQQDYDPDGYLAEVNLDGYRASLGMPDAEAITLAELQERRRLIRDRLVQAQPQGRRRLHANWLGKGPRGKMTPSMTADCLSRRAPAHPPPTARGREHPHHP